jgi:hypothetical protein
VEAARLWQTFTSALREPPSAERHLPELGEASFFIIPSAGEFMRTLLITLVAACLLAKLLAAT